MPVAIIIEGPNKVGKTALAKRFKSVADIITLKFPDIPDLDLLEKEYELNKENQTWLDESFLKAEEEYSGYKEYPGVEIPLPGFNVDDEDESHRHILAAPLFMQLLKMIEIVEKLKKPFIVFDRLPSITTKVYFGNVVAYLNEITLEFLQVLFQVTETYVVLILPEEPFEEDSELEEYYEGSWEDVKAGYESLTPLWAKKFLNAKLIKTRNWFEALEAVDSIIEDHEKD